MTMKGKTETTGDLRIPVTVGLSVTVTKRWRPPNRDRDIAFLSVDDAWPYPVLVEDDAKRMADLVSGLSWLTACAGPQILDEDGEEVGLFYSDDCGWCDYDAAVAVAPLVATILRDRLRTPVSLTPSTTHTSHAHTERDEGYDPIDHDDHIETTGRAEGWSA